jgi:hypothetical protein
VSDLLGVALILAGSALGLVTSFVLWRRLPAAPCVLLAVASGALVGSGALVVQSGTTTADWAVTLFALGALTPVHSRLLFGRPGGGA